MPEQRIAQFKQSVDTMEAALREAGITVDISRVNVADIRVFAIASAALRLLQAKGLVTQQEVELSVLSVLQEFLGGMLIQVEAQRDSQRARRAKPVAASTDDLKLLEAARRRRQRQD